MKNHKFIIDINEFESLSRDVGYYNAQSNIKHYDEDGDEFYDEGDIRKYEELREKQLIMLEELIEKYGK